VGNSWLYVALFRQRNELWQKVGYMKLCLDREYELCSIISYPSVQCLRIRSAKFQDIYCIEQQSFAVLHSIQCHCNTGRRAIYRSTT
jgi:hypothetical protein